MVIAVVSYILFGKDVNIVEPSEPEYCSTALYWPVPGHYKLSQELHSGGAIDISDGYIEKAPVYAAIGGTVTQTFRCTLNHGDDYGDCYGFGTGLIIAGDDGREYQYAHLFPHSMPAYVKNSARIEAGQQVGEVGNTGHSSGPHLHFEITTGNSDDETVIDPQQEIYKDIY